MNHKRWLFYLILVLVAVFAPLWIYALMLVLEGFP